MKYRFGPREIPNSIRLLHARDVHGALLAILHGCNSRVEPAIEIIVSGFLSG
jgi:hypothetical protein